jgi:hypothetical protein
LGNAPLEPKSGVNEPPADWRILLWDQGGVRGKMGRIDYLFYVGLAGVLGAEVSRLILRVRERRQGEKTEEERQNLLNAVNTQVRKLQQSYLAKLKKSDDETEFVDIIIDHKEATTEEQKEDKNQSFTKYLESSVKSVDLLLRSSPAWAWHADNTEREGEITVLKKQIEEIKVKIENHKSEIIEVKQIDPVLQATLTLSIENLTTRIDKLEKDALSKWDVALVVGTVVGGVLLLFGAFVEIAKLLSGK